MKLYRRVSSNPKNDLRTFDITGFVTSVDVDRTMTGASTLTITCSDPDWFVATSKFFDISEDGKFSHIWTNWYKNQYSLVKMTQSGNDTTTLTLEASACRALREQYGFKRHKRSDGYTRAMFIHHLINECNSKQHNVYIKFYCPQEFVKQRVAKNQTAKTDPNQPGQKGYDAGDRKHLKSTWDMTNSQLDVVERILTVADNIPHGGTRGAPYKARAAMCLAGWAETKFDPNAAPSAGHSYEGLFQWLYGHGYSEDQIEGAATYWLKGGRGFQLNGGIAATLNNPSWTLDQIAEGVEGSGTQYHGEAGFARFPDLARDLVNRFDGGTVSTDQTKSGKGDSAQYFERQKNENSWQCINRLADEVNWSVWEDGQTIYFMSDEEVFLQKPQRVVNRTEYDSHITNFAFDWDEGKYISTITLTTLSDHWHVNPGHNVEVIGAGPADRRWLVHEVHRTGENEGSTAVFLPQDTAMAEVTLQTVSAPKLEPAVLPTSGTTSQGGSATSSTTSTAKYYYNPYKNWPTKGRIDQGWDVGASIGTEIGAVGDAEIVGTYMPGWGPPNGISPGGYVWYKLLEGDHKGKYIYVAEGITVTVHPGQKVKKGDNIARVSGRISGGLSIETGWAVSSGATLSRVSGTAGHYPTPEGNSFYKFMQAVS